MLFEYYEPELVESAGGGVVHSWQGMPRGTMATRQRRGTTASIPRRLDFLTGACMLMRASTLDGSASSTSASFLLRRHRALAAHSPRRVANRARGRRRNLAQEWGIDAPAGGPAGLLYSTELPPAGAQALPNACASGGGVSLYRCALPKILRRDWTDSAPSAARIATSSASSAAIQRPPAWESVPPWSPS